MNLNKEISDTILGIVAYKMLQAYATDLKGRQEKTKSKEDIHKELANRKQNDLKIKKSENDMTKLDQEKETKEIEYKAKKLEAINKLKDAIQKRKEIENG